MKKSRADEALKEFETRRNEAELQAAQACFRQRDLAGCRTHLDKLLARDRHHQDARLLLASICMEENDPNKAVAELRTLAEDFPNSAEIQHSLAAALELTGAFDEAQRHFELAQQLAPANEVFRASYEASIDADVLSTLASVQNEIPDASPSVRIVPSPTSRRQRSEREVVETSASRHHETVPGSGQSPPDGAETNDVFAIVESATRALQAGHSDESVKLAEAGILLHPNAPSLHRIKGAAYLESGQNEAARDALDRAICLDNTSAVSYFLLGCAHNRLGNGADARWNFDQAERLDPRYAVAE